MPPPFQSVLAGWSLPSQEIHAVYPSVRMIPAKVLRFIEWMQGSFGDAWWDEAS